MKKVNVEVCTGTACYVMGAGTLLKELMDLSEDWKNKVDVSASLCCEMCRDWKLGKPPIAKVGSHLIGEANKTLVLQTVEQQLKGEEEC